MRPTGKGNVFRLCRVGFCGRIFCKSFRRFVIGRRIKPVLLARRDTLIERRVLFLLLKLFFVQTQRRVFRLCNHLLEQQRGWSITPLLMRLRGKQSLLKHAVGGLCPFRGEFRRVDERLQAPSFRADFGLHLLELSLALFNVSRLELCGLSKRRRRIERLDLRCECVVNEGHQ